ncbi:MAG: peptidylprolyl isomerase [Muribaculaceae bacterium]|nr:peptidylprolyl isomerase [Muribaculaceae bacterium]
MTSIKTAIIAALASLSMSVAAQNNIIDEVAWVIGDDPIYKSEIEEFYQEALQERIPVKGDPYCTLPEQMAIERLFLHQADLDTIMVSEAMIQQQVEGQMNFLMNNLGSKEKIEQYFNKPYSEIRDYYATNMRNRYRVSQVKQALTKDVKVTPNYVRRYVDRLPADSLPYVPLQVEVQIMTLNPVIPREEIESVKARLRDLSERITKGESDFSTMAILYSEDGSSVRGGEIGFKGRADLVAEYAAVAFNLNDPKKVSKIVETEYGYHIIQLIEKRGERVNTRHILLRPKVSDKDLTDAIQRLDSVRTDIIDNHKFTFEEAARYISQDKDTRYSNGVMVNEDTGTTMFEMSQLPQEVAKVVAGLQPGEISAPFVMKDTRRNSDIVAIIKLTNRLEAHTANLADDFQLLKNMYENSAKEEILDKWLQKKIRDTYIRIEEGWRGCEFEHDGWLKNNK